MKTKEKHKKMTQEEIDQIVVAQADDDSAWEEPISVEPMGVTSLSISLPAELVARAAFVARLHRTNHVEEWLRHIIQERLDVEEKIYSEVKRELTLQ